MKRLAICLVLAFANCEGGSGASCYGNGTCDDGFDCVKWTDVNERGGVTERHNICVKLVNPRRTFR